MRGFLFIRLKNSRNIAETFFGLFGVGIVGFAICEAGKRWHCSDLIILNFLGTVGKHFQTLEEKAEFSYTASSNRSLTANFIRQYTLTITTEGNGQVNVSSIKFYQKVVALNKRYAYLYVL